MSRNHKDIVMRVNLIFCLLVSSFWTFAQDQSLPTKDSVYIRPGKRHHQFEEGDTLYTKSGYKFYGHQILKIGSGSGEKGYFRYIFLVTANNTDMTYASNPFASTDGQLLQTARSITYSSYNSNVDITQSMSPSNSGKEFVVVNLKYSGSKRTGYNFSPVIAEPLDGFNRNKLTLANARYYINYENAVNSGELIYPGKQPIGKSPTSVEVKVVQENSKSISIPDELAKLKKLYDSGAISKEEYDVAKKKLLDKL